MADHIDRAMRLARIVARRDTDLHIENIPPGIVPKNGGPQSERWKLAIRDDAGTALIRCEGTTHSVTAELLCDLARDRAIEVTRSAIDTLSRETDAASVLERVAPQLFERLRAAEFKARVAQMLVANTNNSLAAYRAKHPCPFCDGRGSVIGEGGADEPCAECEDRAESAKAGAR